MKVVVAILAAISLFAPAAALADDASDMHAVLKAFEATDAYDGEGCHKMMAAMEYVGELPKAQQSPTWFGTLALLAGACVKDVRAETNSRMAVEFPGGVLITACRHVAPYLGSSDRATYFRDAGNDITRACALVGIVPTKPTNRARTPVQPTCAKPNSDVTITNYVKPEFPESARYLNPNGGTVQVELTIDATGKVVSSSIYKSSNNGAMDQAAVVAARSSTYAARVVDCESTSSDYLFNAVFQP